MPQSQRIAGIALLCSLAGCSRFHHDEHRCTPGSARVEGATISVDDSILHLAPNNQASKDTITLTGRYILSKDLAFDLTHPSLQVLFHGRVLWLSSLEYSNFAQSQGTHAPNLLTACMDSVQIWENLQFPLKPH